MSRYESVPYIVVGMLVVQFVWRRNSSGAATHTTDARYNPVTVANRIETLGAELRKLERRITAQCYDDTRGYIDATAEQIQARATRLAPHIDEKRDQIAYWEAVRAAQVDSGKATGYTWTDTVPYAEIQQLVRPE
ncbi:hypothetical protein [Cryobacterium sp. SO1]|uniref:hypothetical protein n=1 Tax=Cryobacterium sp. SO1 TaxID=1897061 RepID=UPI0010231634|nr:hypothetical protein [Cryobacterium sp. SO1]RZI36332.1 hypothetical protein BJQ95_01310 [Cryobacterium sp. SO1]